MASTFEDASEDGAAGDAAFEVVHLSAGLVDVERPDDDKTGVRGKISKGNGDLFRDVFTQDFDVVLQLRGNGNDGLTLCHRPLDKGFDVFVLLVDSMIRRTMLRNNITNS
jgi:hypothetical protein